MPFPPSFDHAWDLTQPPDTQLLNQGALDFRNLKDDIMQRLSLLSGTLANRPTPEIVNATWGGSGFGLLYFSTDNGKIYQWSGAAWVDVTTSFIVPPVNTPQIVNSLNLTAQQGNIAPTTLYAVPTTGLYRVTASIVQTQVATTSGSLPFFVLTWTDADSNTAITANFLVNSSNNNTLGSLDGFPGFAIEGIYAKTGTNITYSTTNYSSTGATPLQYALRSRLEFLGT
jgi:hypothetical protein